MQTTDYHLVKFIGILIDLRILQINAMFQNHIKIAFRNLWRNKTFSFINLFGLTMGTACCLYIILFVQDHLAYDKHHTNSENIYRIISDLDFPNDGGLHEMATCSPPIPPAIQMDFPEVELATRALRYPGVDKNLIRVGEKIFSEESGFYVDSTFFSVLDYHFLEGDSKSALNEPFSAVISEKLAKKLFDGAAAIGETIGISIAGRENNFKITGIFDHQYGKSHLMTELFMTMNSGGLGQYVRTNTSWAGNNFVYGYLKLKPGADAEALEAKLPDFLQKYGAEQLAGLNMKKELHLQPITAIHTTVGLNGDRPTNTSKTFLNILLLIAGFIQLVACINFMNLTTARSNRRAQEVGVRKTIGASRGDLISQFLGESILITLVAVGLAIPLLEFCLPFVNNLTGAEIALNLMGSGFNLTLILGFILLTGILAGSYPAFYLSSFKPISILGGMNKSKGNRGTVLLRKGLVVGQFTVATALVIGAIIIQSQLNYMLQKDLGFEKNQKIVIPFNDSSQSGNLEAFRNELMRLPEVNAATAINEPPGRNLIQDIPLYKSGGSMENSVDIQMTYTDDFFFETLKIDLLSGRGLSKTDTSSQRNIIKVVVNEKAINQLGISVEDAPGTVLYSDFENIHIEATIVGVMENVLYQNLTKEVEAFMVAAAVPDNLLNLVADVNTTDYPTFISKAEDTWKSIMPNLPFEFTFLDSDIAQLYQTEQTLSRIIGIFTLMAILISCLGLFGLSAFAAEQRTKEIGIRKVLGATTTGLVGLLSKDFLTLIIAALFIASPLAYFFMDKWLADFAHRIDISWWIFVLAGFVAISIAFLTVGFQSVKAALANPVESLRSE